MNHDSHHQNAGYLVNTITLVIGLMVICSVRKFSVSVLAIFKVSVSAEISVHILAEISVKEYVKNQNFCTLFILKYRFAVLF